MHFRSIGVAVALCLLCAGVAQAKTVHFTAALKGAAETPPNATTGTGKVDATLDTASKTFTYTVTYSGLTGAAGAAHFHVGAVGVSGPPALPVPPANLASPIKGTATLTDAQAADLTAGKWYFNIHTAANPGGEVRGQLTAAP
ncbi:MAG: CHRD domain-containing protein [Caulobacterales bacterium]